MRKEDYYDETLASGIQRPDVGELVTLYQLDLVKLGGDVLYFTQAVKEGQGPIFFNSQEYTPIDIAAEGFDISTEGTMPRPKLAVSNVDSTLAALVISYNDFLGCKLIRIRTISKYLDGEPEADPTVEFPRDIYIIQQKVMQNKQIIQWELAAKTDLENLKIPKRQILRDTCTHSYRTYDGTDFIYNDVTCPYNGEDPGDFFKSDGTPCTEAEDECGRKLSDCILRHTITTVSGVAVTSELPTRAFPMVARTRF